MKVTGITVILTWEDGTINDVTNYLPAQTFRSLECFADYWEEKHNDDEEESKDE
jgi:hypothetical protein